MTNLVMIFGEPLVVSLIPWLLVSLMGNALVLFATRSLCKTWNQKILIFTGFNVGLFALNWWLSKSNFFDVKNVSYKASVVGLIIGFCFSLAILVVPLFSASNKVDEIPR